MMVTVEIRKNCKEQRARAMDDVSKPIGVIARKIATDLDTTPETIRIYLTAKRNGFKSSHEHRIARGNFSSARELFDNYATKMGWRNWDEYRSYRKFLKSEEEETEQQKFDQGIELVPDARDLLNIPQYSVREAPPEYTRVEEIMRTRLPDRHRIVLEDFFFHDQTLSSIAKRQGVKRQAIGHVKRRAINKLRDLLEREYCIPQEEIQDGEIIFIHAFRHAGYSTRQTAELLNSIWHDSKMTQNSLMYRIGKANKRKVDYPKIQEG
ncbi:hypothetical protein COU60_02280 [Candidatus Pacearchaeota archaeon CG10_big_fil_rev_8_21_14_0_10_34_76]|nr:MAG: hypothetical protein COU60_02280 [Candidatus Pacearchaeota archaeon CG10_big_fil_rev_8_21_14_0_10_34_76]